MGSTFSRATTARWNWESPCRPSTKAEYQGRGLAAEAIANVLRYLFDSLGKHRVWALTDAENGKAGNLFRRLGVRQEAHFVENIWYKGAWGSEFVFAILRREWLERAGLVTADERSAD
ncbi:GNAT family N-acetyltransferase [Anatilimnocola aggregata]|uniref:GNAT family N-acetyltransferase n=1 Tax=Anatilimnocola aggregata TaxID=2528021 RepID=UPI00192E462A|nr:GNAT family protein [Anatilimnocola aggregata]